MVSFKPTNIEDFDDVIELERNFIQKFVEQGDLVKILEGNNKSKTGLVMQVSDDNFNATVRMDISNEEVKYKVKTLKLITAADRE